MSRGTAKPAAETPAPDITELHPEQLGQTVELTTHGKAAQAVDNLVLTVAEIGLKHAEAFRDNHTALNDQERATLSSLISLAVQLRDIN